MSLQSTDPIADLLTRIRNAIMVGKTEVHVPASKLKKVVAEKLVSVGYLHEVKEEKGSPRSTLVIKVNKPGGSSTITEIKRISSPGRRVYTGANDVPKIKSGRGVVLISTSQGVLTGTEAKKQRLGGEVLLSVY